LPDRFSKYFKDHLRRPSAASLVAWGLFFVALAVRLYWVEKINSPFDNIFSDMGGYVQRALQAAFGHGDPYPIFNTLYPPGAHGVYAVEMRLLGWEHHDRFLVVNCMWGAVVAPCTMLLALRIVPRLWVATLVGLVAAFWYPVVCFAGYFSSEQPYAGAIALSAWLLVRHLQTGKNAIALGLASSVAYLVRPQIIMTLAALTLVGLYILWRRPRGAPKLRVGWLLVAGGILTATVVYGAVRYHALCGRWGLISDNAAMTRLWADTNYGKVRAKYRDKDGRMLEFFFGSPPKGETGENRELYFDGYVGDPVLLDKARRNEVHYMSASDRIVRWVKNVRLLFVDNSLWPDSDHLPKTGWRHDWCEWTKKLVLLLAPLVLLGIVSAIRRPRTAVVVCAAHVVTMLIVAAFFYAEMRYRVPYDIFILLLALEGGRQIVAAGKRVLERSREKAGAT
jgi:hypothetical protein